MSKRRPISSILLPRLPETQGSLLVEGRGDGLQPVHHPLLERRDALVERGGDFLGAAPERAVDLAGPVAQDEVDLVGPLAQQRVDFLRTGGEDVVDLIGAAAEGEVDLVRPRSEHPADGLDLGGQRLGDGAALGRDGLAEVVDPSLEGIGDVATALGHDAGHLAGPHDERFVDRRGARAESVIDPFDQGIEGGGDLVGAPPRMVLERRELHLDGARGLAGALGQGVGDRASLDRDEAIHLLEAARDGLGETADVAGDAFGDLAAAAHDVLEGRQTGAQGLLDLDAAPADGVVESIRGPIERVVDAGSLRGDGQDDVLARGGETGMGLAGMGGERLREFLPPRLEHGLELVDPGADEGGDALADLRQVPLEGMTLHGDGLAHAKARTLETVRQILDPSPDGLLRHLCRALELLAHLGAAQIDLARDLGAGARQAFAHLAAPHHDLVHDLAARGDELHLQPRGAGREFVENAAGVRGEPDPKSLAAGVDLLDEGCAGGRELVANLVVGGGDLLAQSRAAADDVLQHLGVGRDQLLPEDRAAVGQFLAHRLASRGDLVAHVGGPRRDILGDHAACRRQFLGDLGPAGREAVFQVPGGVLEGLAHVVALLGQRVDDAAARLGKGAGDLARAVLEMAGQEIARPLERAADILRLDLEGARDGGADLGDPGLDVLARAGQAVDELDAAGRHVLHDALARPPEGLGDLFAALLQGSGNAFARSVDRRHDALSGGVEILRQVLVRARDGAAHALGVGDDRFALGHEFVDERADADLVVGIGAFQRRDLAPHEGLELAGAGESPLHAVPDRGDLAAHGLGDRQDCVGREGFRLRETHGDLADGAGHELHLLRADRHDGRHVEEHDRGHHHEGADGELGVDEGIQECLRRRDAAGIEDRRRGADPEERRERCPHIRRTRGTDLEGLQHHAGIAAVVVGDRIPVGGQERRAVCPVVQRTRPGVGPPMVGVEVPERPIGEIMIVDIREPGLAPVIDPRRVRPDPWMSSRFKACSTADRADSAGSFSFLLSIAMIRPR